MARNARSIATRQGDGTWTGGTVAFVAGAAALAAAAAWNTARAFRAEREHPPLGRFVEIDGVRLHFLERGSGPPVVLLHGNIVSAEDFIWSGLLDLLSERHRVIAFDRPGFGHSERPQGTLWTASEQAHLLAGAFAALGIERPVVLGHSWGVLVALSLALEEPQTVGGLVLLSGYYRPTARLDAPLPALAAVPVLGDLLRYTVSPLVSDATLTSTLQGMFWPMPIPERVRIEFPYGFPARPWQIRAEGQDAATMVPAAADLQRRYADLMQHVTIIAGTDDKVVDHEHQSMWFNGVVHGSALRLVRGAGHMVHHAAPDEVAETVTALHRRLPGRATPVVESPPTVQPAA